MNARDLLHRTLSGQSAPSTPNGPLGVHFCAGMARFTVRQYTTQARLLAESVLRYHERFKSDAVWPPAILPSRAYASTIARDDWPILIPRGGRRTRRASHK